MDQLAKLWEYQKVDLKVSAIENKLKASETRKKLLVARNYLRDAQQSIKNMEAESSAMRVSYDTVMQKMEDFNERIGDIDGQLSGDAQEMTMQEVDRLKKDAAELRDQLTRQERDLQNILKGIEKIEATMRKLVTNVPRAKSDFDILKKLYDGEIAAVSQETEPLRQQLSGMEPDIDGTILERYKAIKKRCVNPMAPVVSGQCTGCNMELPSAAQKKLTSEKATSIECDNCGRILFINEWD